jgi:hypothetical protein
MEVVQFIYNEKTIDFEPAGKDNVMVNATQMAKVFGKRVDHFLRSDHANEFINVLLITPYGGNKAAFTRDEIVFSNKKGGTWMHRLLALKFAAWLDPAFELWVFATIDKIILGHYKEVRSANEEEAQKEHRYKMLKRAHLEKHPDYEEVLQAEAELSVASRKRMKAVRVDRMQTKLDLFPNSVK